MELVLVPLLLLLGLATALDGGGDDSRDDAGGNEENDVLSGVGRDRVFGGEGDDLLTLDDQAQGLGGEGMTRLRRAMRPWAMGWRATTA